MLRNFLDRQVTGLEYKQLSGNVSLDGVSDPTFMTPADVARFNKRKLANMRHKLPPGEEVKLLMRKPVKLLQITVVRLSGALQCTATAQILILAHCSAIPMTQERRAHPEGKGAGADVHAAEQRWHRQ